MVIYVDILIGVNIYVTYFLLLATEKLSSSPSSAAKKALASLLGGLSSLIIFLPPLSDLLLILLKAVLAIAITLLAFGFRSSRSFFRCLIWFFSANFLFAGSMIALWSLFKPPRLVIRNGTVYYHVSALTLLLSTLAAYGAVRLFARLWERKLPKETFRTAVISINRAAVTVKVFYDSGNTLYSLSGLPVVVCCQKFLSPLLPQQLLQQDLSALSALTGEWRRKTELIPCSTVSGEKLLIAVRPDSFSFEDGKNRPCMLALTQESFCDGFADAIAGSAVFLNT